MIMRIPKRYVLFVTAAITVAAVLSCSGDDVVERRVPIAFSRSIVESKGAAALTTDGMSAFGLYAAYMEQSDFNESLSSFNNIVNGEFVEDNDKWVGATDYYWPLSGSLSFVAYAPYSKAVGGITGLTVPHAGAARGFPVFTYTPPTDGIDVDDMPDLCLSTPLLNRSQPLNGEAEVPLEFHHVLTGVSFYGHYTVSYPAGDFGQDYQVRLHSMVLDGLIGTKWIRSVGHAPYFEWQSDEGLPRTEAYTLDKAHGQVIADALDSESNLLLNPGNGRLYLLPQTPPAAWVTISYGVYLKSDGSLLATFTTDAITLPSMEWAPGEQLDFNLGGALRLNVDEVQVAPGCENSAPVFYDWTQNR